MCASVRQVRPRTVWAGLGHPRHTCMVRLYVGSSATERRIKNIYCGRLVDARSRFSHRGQTAAAGGVGAGPGSASRRVAASRLDRGANLVAGFVPDCPRPTLRLKVLLPRRANREKNLLNSLLHPLTKQFEKTAQRGWYRARTHLTH